MFDYQDFYQKLQFLLQKNEPIWMATLISADGSTPAKPGMHLAVPIAENPLGNLGGGNLEYTVINLIREKQPAKITTWKFTLDEQGKPLDEDLLPTTMICGGKVEVFVEPLFPTSNLFIIGAGHCGKALAHLAVLGNFSVTVIDNRQELLSKEEFPTNCRLIYNDYFNIEEAVNFAPGAFIVIMTYGHVHDKQVLEYCLRKPFFYLGMIGSEKKVSETFAKLRTQGFTEEELLKVHAPIGISIGSQTPYEIAVSITAQLIKERNRLR